MASTIQLKTGTGSAVPSSLTNGEVAINVENGLVYYGSGSGNDVKQLESFTNVTASGVVSASQFINQVIPVVQNTAYFNGVGGVSTIYVGNNTYGWNDRVWNKSYSLSGGLPSGFNGNANNNCLVYTTHKLKNIRLVGNMKPSAGAGTVGFYVFKESVAESNTSDGAVVFEFICSGSATVPGTNFKSVEITGSAAGGHGGYNPLVSVEAGQGLLIAPFTDRSSGNIKFSYTVTGELDE